MAYFARPGTPRRSTSLPPRALVCTPEVLTVHFHADIIPHHAPQPTHVLALITLMNAKRGKSTAAPRNSRPRGGKPGRPRLHAIYDELRERICLLRYPPGMVLREKDLAKEFGLSRTPIRQVLQRLEFAGLARTADGVGTVVTGFDLKAVKDVFDVRERITELIGELSPLAPSDEVVETLERLQQRAQNLRGSDQVEEFWRINHALQLAIGRLIGNEALRSMHDLFYYQVARVWYALVEKMWVQEVEALRCEIAELLKAMRAGDVRAVGFIRRNYIAYARKLVSRHIEESSGRDV